MDSISMHIEFRSKFNKINSNKNKAFLPQEIDLLLNDQMDKFVESRTTRKSNAKQEGFEDTQKRLDDIRTIIKEGSTTANVPNNVLLVFTPFPKGKAVILPADYNKLVSDSSTTENTCAINDEVPNRLLSSEIIATAMRDSFHKTHYLSPISEIVNNNLRVYEDNFTVNAINIVYVYKYPRIVYNSQNCVLPDHTHREIVDLAVAKADAIVNEGNYEKYLNEITKNE